MSTGVILVGPTGFQCSRTSNGTNARRLRNFSGCSLCEKSAIGRRDMRNLEQGPVLHPTVGVACFVVPNKEHYYSEQATFVCAL